MKVTVLGATGRTGRHVVEELLRRGHPVTALARDPGKLGPLAGRVSVVTGEARDAAALAAAVTGADAVLSALGPVGKDRTLHTDVAPRLVEAMRSAGVRRFVGISGAGVDAPGDRKSRRDRIISKLVHVFGGAVAQDKERERETWAASGLDWTLVRPPRIVDGPGTGEVAHDAVHTQRSTKITRPDLARFLVDQLEDARYVGALPFVAAS